MCRHFDKTTNKFTVTQETTFDLGDPTTEFDGDGTRFFANVDTFANKDEGDRFIKFQQTGPFDRLPYTER